MDVKDGDFKASVLEKSKKTLVLVDFWAEWCRPCLMLKPILEKVEKDYKGKFVLVKANVDDNQQTASTYGVQGIPAVKLFKDGKIIDEFTGAVPEDVVRIFLDKNL